MPNLIQLKDVSFSLSGQDRVIEILHEISFSLERGEMLSVYGRSGSGKSTLLSLIAGLQLPTSGWVKVLGRDTRSLTEEGRARLRRGNIGFIYQDFQLLPHLNAWENAVLPLQLLGRGIDSNFIHEQFERYGLGDRVKHFPAQLSGGEQQRVAIMRAILFEPTILLADEPTGNLDQKTAAEFTRMFTELTRLHRMAVLVVSHDQAMIDSGTQSLELN